MVKSIAIVLTIIALSKLLIASDNRRIELRKLVSDLPVHSDFVDPVTKSIIIADALLELICVIALISII